MVHPISGMRYCFSAVLVALACLVPGCYRAEQISVVIKAVEGAGAVEDGATEAPAAAAGFGGLAGTVTYDGEAPQPPVVVKAGDGTVKDAAVCASATIPDETLVVNPQSKGISNVVVFLDKKPANIAPELAQAPEAPIVFDQKGCRFLPHVLSVRVGQPLIVMSDDAIAHNTHTFPSRNTPFNQAIKPNDRVGVPCNYSKAENGPIEVKCDLHPWMRAWHFPIDHPYVAITDENGKFHIAGVPAGKHVFKVWQEKVGLLERKLEITIQPDQDTTRDLSYGSAKFGAVPRKSDRSISFAQLSRGGTLDSSP